MRERAFYRAPAHERNLAQTDFLLRKYCNSRPAETPPPCKRRNVAQDFEFPRDASVRSGESPRYIARTGDCMLDSSIHIVRADARARITSYESARGSTEARVHALLPVQSRVSENSRAFSNDFRVCIGENITACVGAKLRLHMIEGVKVIVLTDRVLNRRMVWMCCVMDDHRWTEVQLQVMNFHVAVLGILTSFYNVDSSRNLVSRICFDVPEGRVLL